jgi:large subunit ribosomal protein L3
VRDFSFLIQKNMKFILGIKGKMTQVFDEKGVVSPATILTVSPMKVTQVKTVEKDGYQAVQVGSGLRKDSRASKPLKGHLKDLELFRHLREYPAVEGARGDVIDASVFAPGDIVTVSAISKGKGFQGVVKRHGFHGGPRSHGQKNKERSHGSISGGGRSGGKVAKNMRMGGRMGNDRITVKNLRILQVDVASHTMLVRGAIPGRPGTLVEVSSK